VTEGGVDEAGVFHVIPRRDDSLLAEREAWADSHIPDNRPLAVVYKSSST
jgi:hypothetical protein